MTNLYQDEPVRIGPIARVPELLRQFCVNPEKVFEDANLPSNLFEDADNLISFSARSHLIQLCCEKTGCEHFGLLIGQQTDISSLGLIGYLSLNSHDVGIALNNLVRYFHLHSKGSMLSRKTEDDYVFFGYRIYQSGAEAISQIEDAAVAIIHNTLGSLCGPKWSPVEVRFGHRKPKNLQPYRDFFGARLRFDTEYSGIFFDAECLQWPIESADPVLYRLLKKQVDQLDVEFGSDFPAQVRRMVIVSLPMGQAHADQIAALFAIHPKTLNRRLKVYGTSFKDIADEARYELTRQLLNTSDMKLSEISEVVGYADASAFTKAFKRWTGLTPSVWRTRR